jgi:glycosidase
VISKPEGLPDDAPGHSGISPYYFNGPRFVEFISEIKKNVFDNYDIFTVGEMPNVTPEHGESYTRNFTSTSFFKSKILQMASATCCFILNIWMSIQFRNISNGIIAL